MRESSAAAIHGRVVNNDIYNTLGERWYRASDDPVALLRAENRSRNPWLIYLISEVFGDTACEILDVGCGAGFLANDLSAAGHRVTGLDNSEASLTVARAHDRTGRVKYIDGDAVRVPFRDRSFDVVCAMDFLEHVPSPRAVIEEASRVLRPGGLFFFHTFNRNLLSWLIAIKGVEWFVKNTPKDLHVLRSFIKPRELVAMCDERGLHVPRLMGARPVFGSRAFWKLVFTREVAEDFEFCFTRSTMIAYLGVAIRRP